MAVLYHFTSTWHLPKIMKSGFLKLTESNLRWPEHPMYKPVVWMTTSPIPVGMGLEGSAVNKKEICFTIKMQRYFKRWKKFKQENKMDWKWAKRLETGYDADSWWISENVVPLSDIIKIENMQTGEVYKVETYGG